LKGSRFLQLPPHSAKTARGCGGKIALKAGKPDFVRQNDLILDAVFEPNGNANHHHKCVTGCSVY